MESSPPAVQREQRHLASRTRVPRILQSPRALAAASANRSSPRSSPQSRSRPRGLQTSCWAPLALPNARSMHIQHFGGRIRRYNLHLHPATGEALPPAEVGHQGPRSIGPGGREASPSPLPQPRTLGLPASRMSSQNSFPHSHPRLPNDMLIQVQCCTLCGARRGTTTGDLSEWRLPPALHAGVYESGLASPTLEGNAENTRASIVRPWH